MKLICDIYGLINIRIMVYDQSAALDLQVLKVGDHADAGPAVGLHLVEVFHAG